MIILTKKLSYIIWNNFTKRICNSFEMQMIRGMFPILMNKRRECFSFGRPDPNALCLTAGASILCGRPLCDGPQSQTAAGDSRGGEPETEGA
jgi:hypothetical protein